MKNEQINECIKYFFRKNILDAGGTGIGENLKHLVSCYPGSEPSGL